MFISHAISGALKGASTIPQLHTLRCADGIQIPHFYYFPHFHYIPLQLFAKTVNTCALHDICIHKFFKIFFNNFS